MQLGPWVQDIWRINQFHPLPRQPLVKTLKNYLIDYYTPGKFIMLRHKITWSLPIGNDTVMSCTKYYHLNMLVCGSHKNFMDRDGNEYQAHALWEMDETSKSWTCRIIINQILGMHHLRLLDEFSNYYDIPYLCERAGITL